MLIAELRPVPEPLPERLQDALPRADFDAGLQALLASEADEAERRVEVDPWDVPMTRVPVSSMSTAASESPPRPGRIVADVPSNRTALPSQAPTIVPASLMAYGDP